MEQGISIVANPEIKQLRQQIARLDPANKSIRVRGFKAEAIPARVACIEKELQGLGASHFTIEHIYKGPAGQRVLTDMCLIDLGSNSTREKVLKDLSSKPVIKDQARGELNFDRAKTASQLQRNAILRKVQDLVKKDERARGKKVEIVWRMTDTTNKDREITVENVSVFRQTIDDMKGSFLDPFTGPSV